VKRTLGLLVLLGFLVYTGAYVFVYLFRAFRLPEPATNETVSIWHGDPMTRAVLAAVLFAIGLLILLFVSLNQAQFRKEGSVRLRPDLWDWVNRRAEETNETPQRITERSIAAYRDHLDEGVRSA
jgi:hypothetical protein